MAPTIEELLVQHEAYTRGRIDQVIRWLLGEISIQDTTKWGFDHPQPVAPSKTDPPPLTWYYRPPDLTSEDYRSYELCYQRVFTIGNMRFRKGSGRNLANGTTRFGRLNHPASVEALRAWHLEETGRTDRWRRGCREIDQKIGVEVWDRIPHHRFETEGSHYVVVLMPGGYFQIYSGTAHFPACFTSGGYTANPKPHEFFKLIKGIQREQDCTYEEARVLVDAGTTERSGELSVMYLMTYCHMKKSRAKELVEGFKEALVA